MNLARLAGWLYLYGGQKERAMEKGREDETRYKIGHINYILLP